MVKCFKCDKLLDSACEGIDAWEAPGGGVLFDGGYNFGSRIYDAMIDGIVVQIIICDECLEINKEKIREKKK